MGQLRNKIQEISLKTSRCFFIFRTNFSLKHADIFRENFSIFFHTSQHIIQNTVFQHNTTSSFNLRQCRLKGIKNPRLRESFIHNSRGFSINTYYTQRLGVSHTFVSVQLISNVCPPHFIVKSPFSRRHLPS